MSKWSRLRSDCDTCAPEGTKQCTGWKTKRETKFKQSPLATTKWDKTVLIFWWYRQKTRLFLPCKTEFSLVENESLLETYPTAVSLRIKRSHCVRKVDWCSGLFHTGQQLLPQVKGYTARQQGRLRGLGYLSHPESWALLLGHLGAEYSWKAFSLIRSKTPFQFLTWLWV